MGEFARRVIKIRREKLQMSEVEIDGDPAAVASVNIELQSTSETVRIGPPRASRLYDDCMRMRVLGTVYKRTMKQWSNFADKMTYGIGSAVHYWMQNEPDIFGDRRRGWWRCAACNRILYFGGPPKQNCRQCGARKEAIIYHEHSLNLKNPLPVTGHPDMFFEKVNGIFRTVEIKTMTGDQFDSLHTPMIANVWQLETYMWACSQKGSKLPIKIDSKLGYLLYVSKKHGTGHLPLKMFPVKSDPSLVGRIKRKLRQYKRGMKGFPNDLPERYPDCVRSNLGSYRARTCSVLKECKEHA